MGSAKKKMIWNSFFEKMSGQKGSALVSSSYRYTGGMNIWSFEHFDKITTLSCSLLMFSCLFTVFYNFLSERGQRVQTGGDIDFSFHFRADF